MAGNCRGITLGSCVAKAMTRVFRVVRVVS